MLSGRQAGVRLTTSNGVTERAGEGRRRCLPGGVRTPRGWRWEEGGRGGGVGREGVEEGEGQDSSACYILSHAITAATDVIV